MVDDERNNSEYQHLEEEYQFIDDGDEDIFAAGEESTTTAPASNAKPPFYQHPAFRRNVLIGLGIILSLFAVYNVMKLVFGAGKSKTDALVDANMAVTTSVVDSAYQAPVDSVAVMAPSERDIQMMRQKVAAVELTSDNVNRELQRLANTLDRLDKRIVDMESKLNTASAMVIRTTQQLDKQQGQIRELKDSPVGAPSPTQRHGKGGITDYFVQAMIPGRAWIVNADGNTLTVREGSQLPGYGTITQISPELGQVLLSSGAVILYAQDDS